MGKFYIVLRVVEDWRRKHTDVKTNISLFNLLKVFCNEIDGWLTWHFTFFFQYFSHIRTMEGDNEELCAMKPSLQL